MRNPVVVISINSAWNILNFRMALIRRLQTSGFDVVAIVPPGPDIPVLEAAGLTCVPLAMDRGGVSPIRDVKLLAGYFAILRKIKPRLYLGYTIKPNVYGSLVAHALGIPVINNISGLGTAFIRRGLLTQIARLLYRVALARSSTVFFQNSDDSALFASLGLVTKQARLVPGSGIDLAAFAPTPLPSSGDATVFLMIARLLHDKGVTEFVTAAARLRCERPELRFQLLGGRDEDNPSSVSAEQLAQWVASGAVEHLGVASDVRPFIAAADCVVLPSYREGLPRVLLEGGAMGRPLVATDVPGCRDLVDEGVNGHLCPARDAQALAHAMKSVADAGAERRAAMGAASRRKVAGGFGEDAVIEPYMAAIAAALKVDELGPGLPHRW